MSKKKETWVWGLYLSKHPNTLLRRLPLSFYLPLEQPSKAVQQRMSDWRELSPLVALWRRNRQYGISRSPQECQFPGRLKELMSMSGVSVQLTPFLAQCPQRPACNSGAQQLHHYMHTHSRSNNRNSIWLAFQQLLLLQMSHCRKLRRLATVKMCHQQPR